MEYIILNAAILYVCVGVCVCVGGGGCWWIAIAHLSAHLAFSPEANIRGLLAIDWLRQHFKVAGSKIARFLVRSGGAFRLMRKLWVKWILITWWMHISLSRTSDISPSGEVPHLMHEFLLLVRIAPARWSRPFTNSWCMASDHLGSVCLLDVVTNPLVYF